MRYRAAIALFILLAPVLVLSSASCNARTPVQPSTNSSAPSAAASGGGTSSTASLTASIAAPRPILPAQNQPIRNQDQPVTLVVQNAVVTRSITTTYTFQVATDPGFANVVQTKDGVAEGGGGQTSVRLDPLPAAKDYYFNARASAGTTTGVFGPMSKFTIGPAITLSPPTPVAPTTGAQTGVRPTFTVINATRSGPITGPFMVRFEIADNAAFNPIALLATVAEGSSQTSFTPSVDLIANKPYSWRAFTIDLGDGITSLSSAIQVFTPTANSGGGGGGSAAANIASQLGVTLWPGDQPPNTSGHATLGDNWQVQNAVSHGGVPFISPPIDELQVFDLLDHGLDPQGAIDWMHSHGYPTSAAYFPSVQVIGFAYQYMALIRGRWDLVLRGE